MDLSGSPRLLAAAEPDGDEPQHLREPDPDGVTGEAEALRQDPFRRLAVVEIGFEERAAVGRQRIQGRPHARQVRGIRFVRRHRSTILRQPFEVRRCHQGRAETGEPCDARAGEPDEAGEEIGLEFGPRWIVASGNVGPGFHVEIVDRVHPFARRCRVAGGGQGRECLEEDRPVIREGSCRCEIRGRPSVVRSVWCMAFHGACPMSRLGLRPPI